MSDPLTEASTSGWIAEHRALYRRDPAAAHMFDTTFAGGPGPLPTLLLTTIGRKSGKESVMPLLYGEVDGGYAIIASRGGDQKHPGWYHNLRAQDSVKVQIAKDIFEAAPRIVEGAERRAIWDQMVSMYPLFADYQKGAGTREIPVIVLSRV